MLCNSNKLRPLAGYVKKFEKGCPDFFDSISNRCSQTKIKVRVNPPNGRASRKGKYNNACRLAELAMTVCKKNHERHSAVEEFMLVNDSSTVAVEVSVWLYEKSLGISINRHIDVLQVRGGKIYVLDFKPRALKENKDKVMSQLYWYASGLSFRTGIHLPCFRRAWFDENAYFEFDPNGVKLK